MDKSIDVQNAKKNSILNFDEVNETFNDIIFANSKRNIFTNNDEINYFNYKQIIYDYESIERILGEMILPGKVRFNETENLRFVTYEFEAFRGDKTSILCDFLNIYNKQENLSPMKKQKLYEKFKIKYENEIDKFCKILFSIQLLIYYLTQDKKEENEEIENIIKNLPEDINISKEFEEFFENQNFKVKEIFEIFSYIELLCFKPILYNLREHYKMKINENVAENIIKSFEDKKFKIITKITLASACRKFISRYLVGLREDIDFNENNRLDLYLYFEEFWDKKQWEQNSDIIESDLQILSENKITLGQCLELYYLLGGDESEIYKDIIIKNEDEKNDDEEEKIIKKRKKKSHIKY